MSMLIADRFLCGLRTLADAHAANALDLATGQRVRLRFGDAGARADQQAWVEACTRAHQCGSLLDFGFIGPTRKFEASDAGDRAPAASVPGAPADVLDWLETRKASSARILSRHSLPDARAVRMQGFVPLAVTLLSEASACDLLSVLQGHSVVLLDSCDTPRDLAFAFLRLRATVRDMYAIVRRRRSTGVLVRNAAEGRALYRPRTPALAPSSGAGVLVAKGQTLLAAGRHAAAERTLRACAGAFHRRGDVLHAAKAEMALGRLLLTRGRPEAARTVFESACGLFHKAGAAGAAVSATIHASMAQVDLGLLHDAERSCRAAHSAAAALRDREMTAGATVALARTLLWLERPSEAAAILESTAPGSTDEACARYWCLVARLHLAGGRHADARSAIGRARPEKHACSPDLEALVRRSAASLQANMGDLDAVGMHVRAGIAAARAAHLPLQAIKLRLIFVDALVAAGKLGQARIAARHFERQSQTSLPPFVRTRILRTLSSLNAAANSESRSLPAPAAREACASFYSTGATQAPDDLVRVTELMSSSHQGDDETQALSRIADSTQRHLRALGVGIFGSIGGGARLFGSAGAPDPVVAKRSCNAAIPIGPEPAGGWVDAAVPIRYLGRLIGALAMRWTAEGPDHCERAMAFAAAAAATCAPLVYVIVERQSVPSTDGTSSELIGVSSAMGVVRHSIARAANAPFAVLIEGESGSGKELVARAIHAAGSRRERRFCAFNCAAMAEDLVDSELFGHTKGAFTGAVGERLGLFESADHGTVFLDEVGELSTRAQAKILRVIQEGEVRRIGENFSRPFDARLVAATNRSLRAEVDAGRFRQDLLYRLDVIRIRVPPLRERVEDIPLLAAKFWRQSAERIGSRAVLGQAAIAALARYDWPGNVRELQNVLSALVVAAPSRGVVGPADMPGAIARSAQRDPDESLESARLKFEQRFVRAALARAAGHRGRTAAALGLSRQGLAKLMQRLQLDA